MDPSFRWDDGTFPVEMDGKFLAGTTEGFRRCGANRGLRSNPRQSARFRPWYSSSISRLSRASIFIRSLNERFLAFSSNR